MSRFLQSLIDRHLPRAATASASPLAQPRPRARFEQGAEKMAETPGIHPAGYSGASSPGNELDRQESVQRLREKAQVISRTLSPQGETIRSAARQSGTGTATALADIVAPAHSAAGLPEDKAPALDEGRFDVPMSTEGETGRSENPSTSDEQGDAAAQATGHARDPGAATGACQANSPGIELPPHDPGLAPGPARTSVQPEVETAHRGELLPPDWLGEFQRELLSQMPSAGEGGEPTVNVSIGRVEVRASVPQTPRKSSADGAPSGIMSLDEYLRQRDGGRK